MNHYHIQISFIPNTALDIMIKEIEKKKMKGQFLKARISVACQPVLRIKNLSGDIEEDFLKDYFKNKKRSGGGNIEFFEMSREREAVLKFCDPNGKVYLCYCNKRILSNLYISYHVSTAYLQ